MNIKFEDGGRRFILYNDKINSYIQNMNIKIPYYSILIFMLLNPMYINDNGDIDVNISNDHNTTALMKAVYNNNLEAVKYLIKIGADINFQGSIDRTPLIEAIRSGFLDIAKYLIDKGAYVDIRDRFSETALDYAIEEGYTEIVNYINSNGVKKYK